MAQVINDLAILHTYSSDISEAKKSEKKKLYFWKSVFSLCFASGLSPYNDAFLTNYKKSTKNLKVQVI